jgi:hypothetical protein
MARMTTLAAGLLAAGLIATLAPSAEAASSPPPLWYVQQTGAYIPLGLNSGLEEITSPETLQGSGDIVLSAIHTSDCISRSRQLIEDPPMPIVPGSGSMEQFELLCEKSTGAANGAEAYPCLYGEPFEVRQTKDWAGTIEEGPKQKNQKMYEEFPKAAVEVYCTKNGLHDEYTAALHLEIVIGKLLFIGAPTGVFEDHSGHHFNFKGKETMSPEEFKAVRAGIGL